MAGEGGVGWLPLALGKKWRRPEEGRMEAVTRTADGKWTGEDRFEGRVAGRGGGG